eukprot:3576062-Pleurochrysis_carterae.AAC.1
MALTSDDKGLVLSLVHAHVKHNPEYKSVVKEHFCQRGRYIVLVSEHKRHKALYRDLVHTIRQVCKFEDVSSKAYATRGTHSGVADKARMSAASSSSTF